jgi:hypothetical protein
MRWTTALWLALGLVAASAARADRFPGTFPLLIRVEGHRGEARPGDRGIADLTLRHRDATIAFHVREIWVLSGDAAGVDVLHEVEAYVPNMSIDGPPGVVERLRSAPPEETLELTGYFRRGQRLFMLSGVERTKRAGAR